VVAESLVRQVPDRARRRGDHGLAELMVRHAVGVVVRDTVEIKAMDEGFFGE
jgi:restriction system protein